MCLPRPIHVPSGGCGGGDGTRTHDRLVANQVLYQLSYAPRFVLVGLSGLEPLTSRLSGGRSNQLSYKPYQEIEPSSAYLELSGCGVGRVALVTMRASYASPPRSVRGVTLGRGSVRLTNPLERR